MHCDHWAKLLLVFSFVGFFGSASSRQYTLEEQNTVVLVLALDLDDYNNDVDGVQTAIFELIANVTTANCTLTRQDCKLLAKYPRNSKAYRREITSESFIFTANEVKTLHPAAPHQVNKTYTAPGLIEITFFIQTQTSYDFLKWTEVVRILYWWRISFNAYFNEMTGRSGNVMDQPPFSYIQRVIAKNVEIPTAIACTMLGLSLMMFLIVIPLSKSKHCRKEPIEKSAEVNTETKDIKV